MSNPDQKFVAKVRAWFDTQSPLVKRTCVGTKGTYSWSLMEKAYLAANPSQDPDPVLESSVSNSSRINSEDEFVDTLISFILEMNPSPRLKSPRGRTEEARAARRLWAADYKVSRLQAIVGWTYLSASGYWQNSINSCSKLAGLLLDGDFSNGLESNFETWLASHPPRCKHGTLRGDTCVECLANPTCKTCRAKGRIIADVWVQRLNGRYSMQFVCDCVAAKLNLPSLKEQILLAEKRENS